MEDRKEALESIRKNIKRAEYWARRGAFQDAKAHIAKAARGIAYLVVESKTP